MISDPYAATYAAIVRLLQQETTLYDANSADRSKIFPANFIDYTATGTRFPAKPPNVKDGDFPALYVDEDTEDDTGIIGTTKTFGQCAWQQKTRLNYAIYIVGPDTRLPLVSALRWAAKVAVLKGGQRLGFTNQTVLFLDVAEPDHARQPVDDRGPQYLRRLSAARLQNHGAGHIRIQRNFAHHLRIKDGQ